MEAASRRSPETAALIVGAGSGTRFGQAKAFYIWRGEPLIYWAARPFVRSGRVAQIVLVVREDDLTAAEELARRLGPGTMAVAGAASRSGSVRCGLSVLRPSIARVLVHDAARPNLSQELLGRILDHPGEAVVPYLELHDALHRREAGSTAAPVDRAGLVRVQTPQMFERRLIERAHAAGQDAADDAALAESLGVEIAFVRGEEENLKVTTRDDIGRLDRQWGGMLVGHGYDVHRLAEGRRLVVCGVEIPAQRGALGHSDADAAAHALMDAILGAAGLPDIGHLFPPSDPRYLDADSIVLLGEVMRRVWELGLRVSNADITVVLEQPRIGPHRDAMRQRLAGALKIDPERVGLKATTAEGLGPVGAGEAIQAWAVATLRSA